MDVSSIISISRTQTNTSVGQKTDADVLSYLNIVYSDIFSRLSTKNKKYAWTYYSGDTVVWQNEYTIPKEVIADNEPKMKRVLKVEVKYETEYKKAKIYDTSPFQNESEYDDYDNPIAIQRDWSLFIFPAPLQAVSDGIKVEWQYIPLPLTLVTTSDNIKLQSEYHWTLIFGLNMWLFWDKQLFDKQALMKQAYEQEVLKIIMEWWNDSDWPYEVKIEDIIYESNKFLP